MGANAEDVSDGSSGIDYDELAERMSGQGQQYTTPRARAVAGSFLQDYRNRESSNDPEQQALYQRYGVSAQRARQILQDARARVAGTQYPTDIAKQLAMTQAYNQPPGYGGYGAQIGKAREGLLQEKLGEWQYGQTKADKLTELDQAINSADTPMLQAQAAMLKQKLIESGNLARNAMNVFGRIDAPHGAGKAGEVPPPNPLDTLTNGFKAGVPVPDWDPFSTYTDPKARAQAEREETKESLGNLDKGQVLESGARNKLDLVDKMDDLEKTGKLRFGTLLPNVDQAIGNWLPPWPYNSEEQAYTKFSKDLARQARMPGERYSMWDGKMLQSIVPTLANSPQGAALLRQATKAGAQQQLDYLQFKKNYIQVNHTEGDADKEWDAYLNSPLGQIFKPTQDGLPPKSADQIQLNPGRIPWQTFFRQRYEQKYPGISKQIPISPVQGYAEGGSVATPGTPASADRSLELLAKFKAGLAGIAGSPPAALDTRAGALTAKYKRGGRVKKFAPGGAATDPTPAPESAADLAGNLGREGLQGATLGWGDEALAGMRALTENGASVPGVRPVTRAQIYARALQEERQRLAQVEQEHPHLATAANVAGSFAMPGVGKLADVIKSGPLWARIAKGMGAGYGLGAVAGAGTSEGDIGDRIDAARTSGTDTALLGPLAGKAFELAGRYGARTLMGAGNLAAKYAVPGSPELAEAMRYPNKGENLMSGALAADEPPATQVAMDRRARTTGAPPSLIDAGPNTAALAATAGSRSAPAASIVAKALADRAAQRQTSVDSLVNRTYAPSEPWSEESKLVAQLKEHSDNNYKAAFSNGVDIPAGPGTPPNWIMQTPTGIRAMQDAAQVMQDRGQAPPILGGPKAGTTLPTEYLDEVRNQLEAQYQKAQTPGAQAAISNMKKQLTEHMRSANPDYDTALAEHGDEKSILKSLQMGRDQYTNMDANKLKLLYEGDPSNPTMYPGLNFTERDAFSSGAIGALQNKLAKQGGSKNLAAQVLKSPDDLQKLSIMLDNPAKFKVFQTGLEHLANQYDTDAAVRKGLKIPEEMDPQEVVRNAAGLAMGATGHHPFFGLHAISNVWHNITQMKPEQAEAVAQALTERDPGKVSTTIRDLAMQRGKVQGVNDLATRAMGTGMVQGALGTGQAPSGAQ